jgi:hypothetical protein
VLGWFSSFLDGRRQTVRCGERNSPLRSISCGVPQGSVLGPILFLLYTADLPRIIKGHGLTPHLYADDTQVYGTCSPAESIRLQNGLSACVDDVAAWMRSNRLQLNTAKTEVLWCSSSRRQHQIPRSPLRVGAEFVTPSAVVRDLGIYLDADLSMRTHVAKVVSSCFGVLRQLRSIRRSVPRDTFRSLVVALVLTRLDYGNAILAGAPDHLLKRLQSVMNAAARLIWSRRKYDHVSPLLENLHWLRAPERIEYKLCVLVYRCLNGLAPSYLTCELHQVADISSRQRLRSAASAALVVPVTRRSTIGDRSFGAAAARAWNSLPTAVVSAESLPNFKRLLKADLFRRSYPS